MPEKRTSVTKKSARKNTRIRLKKLRQKYTPKELFAIAALPFVRIYRRLRFKRAVSTHKTFVLTRRRDLPETPAVESYAKFTASVFRTIWQSKTLFSLFLLTYTISGMVLFGAVQGGAVKTMSEAVDAISDSEGTGLDPFGKALTITTSSVGGVLNSSLNEIQQLYMGVLYVFAGLVVVWLLRNIMSGNIVRLRDGIYNAGAPIIPILLLVIVAVLQALPAALAIFAFSVLSAVGVLSGGIDTGLFAISLIMLVVLTLYFMTTTLFALMIASVQGTYPLQAYVAAQKVILGQRRRVLFRLLWMVLVVIFIWFLMLIPISIIVNATSLTTSLVIPLVVQFLTGFSILYGAAYSYMLYRKMIDDPVH